MKAIYTKSGGIWGLSNRHNPVFDHIGDVTEMVSPP